MSNVNLVLKFSIRETSLLTTQSVAHVLSKGIKPQQVGVWKPNSLTASNVVPAILVSFCLDCCSKLMLCRWSLHAKKKLKTC